MGLFKRRVRFRNVISVKTQIKWVFDGLWRVWCWTGAYYTTLLWLLLSIYLLSTTYPPAFWKRAFSRPTDLAILFAADNAKRVVVDVLTDLHYCLARVVPLLRRVVVDHQHGNSGRQSLLASRTYKHNTTTAVYTGRIGGWLLGSWPNPPSSVTHNVNWKRNCPRHETHLI